jgi:hypothetical protein
MITGWIDWIFLILLLNFQYVQQIALSDTYFKILLTTSIKDARLSEIQFWPHFRVSAQILSVR